MKTITHTLTERERTTRKIALVSLLFLPVYLIHAVLISLEADLVLIIFIPLVILHVVLAIRAWFTRDRAPAIVALLMPIATIPLTILGILLFGFGDGMRLY